VIPSTIVRLRYALILAWAVLGALALGPAARVGDVVGLDLPAATPTESARAAATLEAAFANPATDVLAVVLTGPVADSARRRTVLDTLAHVAARLPFVDQIMRPPQQHTFFAVTLRADSAVEAPGLVPGLRAALVRAAARQAPGDSVLVTGEPALELDARQVSIADAHRLERAALLPAAVVLVIAFGGLVAAALPLVVGLLAITLALAAVRLVGLHLPMAVFVLPIVTMVGLGVGIDYSLLVVTRFREELARGRRAPDAAAASLATAGSAVLVSGGVVAVAFATLLLTPSWETRSVGIGGLLVVAAATALATTLLPPLLALVGAGVNRPRTLAARLTRLHGHSLWARWGGVITRHRWVALGGGLAVVLGLAWPASALRLGVPRQGWFPTGTESARGAQLLRRHGVGGELLPIDVVLQVPPGERLVGPPQLAGLRRLTAALRAVPVVREVRGPTSLRPGMSLLEYALLYGDLPAARRQYPEIFRTWVAPDGATGRLQVVLDDTATVETGMRAVRQIRRLATRRWDGLDRATMLVGGFAAAQVDEERELLAALPWIGSLMLGATALMLLVAFRSVLVPVKAVAMNICAVAASLGVVTLVLQRGVGAGLLGLTEPTGTTFVYVPVLVFVIAFGLGMDYEVFLLSRIKEVFDRTRDNDAATTEGLQATAGVITSAAAIMVIVFAAFAFARVLLAQAVGLGLAAAVLVDATLVRLVIVPAFMHLAGRWNWWPGVPHVSRRRQR
jgi:RND superfamily putative drug exporter